ncbi:MAG: DUF4159 domain-containing protein [Rhodospirillales bacterium]|nr:DUF4159 domain-containing protein [Rhodospirillales bacterium]
MSLLGSLSFAAPTALLALLTLPALWWLLRAMPPAPRRIDFPPVRLLAQLAPSEESVQRTPLWLVALRMVLAAAVILGLAHPIIDAADPLPGTGPVIIVVDDGWAAANNWPARLEAINGLIDQAEREQRELLLIPTAAQPERTQSGGPAPALTPDAARDQMRALQPKPWQLARASAVEALLADQRLRVKPPGAVFWLSSSLDSEPSLGELARSLRAFGAVTVLRPDAGDLPVVLRPPSAGAMALTVTAERPAPSPGEVTAWVDAVGDDGALLARQPLRFAAGAKRAETTLAMPAELRNRLTRLEIDGQSTAAAVILVDERWRRRPVGVVTTDGSGGDADLPLLSSLYYLGRALEPLAEVRRGDIDDLLARELAVLILPDGDISDRDTRERVLGWVRRGGMLVRFAGPRLAQAPDQAAEFREDALLPTPLRAGDRALGGSLAWRHAAALAPFDQDSPFLGLDVPPEVQIERQVLAEPALQPDHQVWARLDDRTPLVTAARRDQGWLVLFHTTANTDWSNFALSGLFVEMLERLLATSRGAGVAVDGPPLAPKQTLDGFGRLQQPPPDARPVAAAAFASTKVGPSHPPGFYGSERVRQALNLSGAIPSLQPLADLPADVREQAYEARTERDLRPWLLGAALLLALADLVASMIMRGLLRVPFSWVGARAARSGAAVAFATALAVTGPPAGAEEVVADGSAIPAALTTRLAYIITGDDGIDDASEAGLTGLADVVNRRTSATLGSPVGVDPARDELAFYPLIYWPISPGSSPLDETAADALRHYMAGGGTIVFDMRDRGASIRLSGLRALAETLDLPPLTPVPADHVLARAFYLLSEFPGRWSGGTVWVERGGEQSRDGVTSVVVGGHDWAAAWAVDPASRPMFAVVPGGDRQREMAYRFGVNLVMHVLTGNYKADQVHLPAILERLGQ